MADITMSIDDTLELDAIIEKSNSIKNAITYDSNEFELTGIQTHTGIFDPNKTGTHSIEINGQTLTVRVVDKGGISDVIKSENLVSWQRFEDGDARDYASDSRNPSISWADGTEYDWTINGATHSSSGGVTDLESGSSSGYFDFNGSNDDLRLSTDYMNKDQDLTLTAWIYMADGTSTQSIIDCDATRLGIAVGRFETGLHIHKYDGNQNSIGNQTTTENTWIHVAATYDSSNNDFTYFENGSNIGSISVGTQSKTYEFVVGANNASGDYSPMDYRFSGRLDDIRYYNTLLTDQEISNIYNQTKP